MRVITAASFILVLTPFKILLINKSIFIAIGVTLNTYTECVSIGDAIHEKPDRLDAYFEVDEEILELYTLRGWKTACATESKKKQVSASSKSQSVLARRNCASSSSIVKSEFLLKR